MAEENQNNGQQNLPQVTGGTINDAPSADSSSAQAASKSANPPAGQVKKAKTEKQIARERERRRRRRQKKKTDGAGLTVNNKLKAGDDLPLLTVKESPENAKLEAPVDVPLIEVPESNDLFEEAKEVGSFPVADPSTAEEYETLPPPEPPLAAPELAPSEPVETVSDEEIHDEPEQILVEPEASEILPIAEDDEVVEPPAPEPVEHIDEESPIDNVETNELVEPVDISHDEELDESQKIFEESPSYAESEVIDEKSYAEETHANVPPEHEENLEKDNQDKAREIHESLLNDDGGLEELPVRQGLMGRFFDKLAELVQGRKSPAIPKARAEVEPEEAVSEPTIIAEVDDQGLPESGPGIAGFIGNIIKIVVVIALIIAAFWVGSSLKLIDRINGLFAPPKNAEVLVVGDNSQVTVDTQLLREWGFQTAQLIGQNLGNSKDLTYNVFFNANYFGKLMDPIFYGQTGVSAAIYYGFGREVEYAKNKFIYYVEYLYQVVNANTVKIDDVLKSNPRRDIALNKYIDESQAIFDQGNTLRKEINVQVDDLKVSLNTLNPDKTRYETDFFASMDDYEGLKANDLLAQFIVTAQTESELKAKLAAMSRLSQNYEAQLVKLKLRIDAVKANKDALVSGVTVTETPGGGLNLIRQ